MTEIWIWDLRVWQIGQVWVILEEKWLRWMSNGHVFESKRSPGDALTSNVKTHETIVTRHWDMNAEEELDLAWAMKKLFSVLKCQV